MENEKLFQLINGGNQMLEKVIACNEYTKRFGLVLTNQDALILANDRKESLKEQQRFEFGESILTKLIYAFCDSPFIQQDNYVDTIGKLQDIFYLYKNESLDEMSDDELIDYMKDAFDHECQGSLEYLEETVLEGFARDVRSQSHGFFGKYEDDDE